MVGARVAFDLLDFFLEERRREESEVHFVFQGAGLPWGDYELMQPFSESPFPTLRKKNLRKPRPTQKRSRGALTSFFF